jgi:glycine/D-amino acid oxidase-like deaminating enzyme
MNQTIDVDVVVIGGGLQGLCTLKELIRREYTAVLLSAGELGGEQTAHSHAFLHEGHMFRRSDNIRHTQSSYRCWESYLADSESKTWEGDFYFGDIDPADFRKHCAAWGNDIASLQRADDCQPPTGFNSDMKFWQGRGTCLNTRWIVDRIGTQHTEQIALVENLRLVHADEAAVVVEAQNPRGEVLRIQARTLVAAAGVGNHGLLAGWPACPIRQQTVKTHMLLVRSPDLEPIAGMFRPVLGKRNALFIAPRTIQGTNIWLISDGTRNVIEYANEKKYDWPESETSDWLKQMIDSLTQLCTNHFRPEMRDRLDWSVYKAPKAESEQPVLGRMPEGPEYYFVDAMRTCVVWPTLLTHIPRASREISENVTWFGPPAAGLRGDALATWLKWRSQPGCAVELWRRVQFQSWREFRGRYLL